VCRWGGEVEGYVRPDVAAPRFQAKPGVIFVAGQAEV
jgi:hypothetical protein